MEYIMIFSLILMILTPTIYLFREYASQSSDDISVNNINHIAKTLADNSRDIFYLGSPSKIVIDVEMPNQIESMWLMNNHQDPDKDKHEYYLMFKLNLKDGPEDFYFISDVPMICDNPYCMECDSACIANKELNDQCGVNNFNCYNFQKRYFSPGIKHYKIEAADNCPGLCIKLQEVSYE